ncbi:MAG: hypothetical protein ACXVK4_01175 [Acidimicrobiia bacterium]
MSRVADQLADVGPALAFLLAAVPLATLLDRLGFFAATVARLAAHDRGISVLALWVLAAATTVVLNLDTTIVLLTPLSVRLARRAGADPLRARARAAAAGEPGVVGAPGVEPDQPDRPGTDGPHGPLPARAPRTRQRGRDDHRLAVVPSSPSDPPRARPGSPHSRRPSGAADRLRILRAEAVDVTVRGYVGAVAPFALPALAAATAAMVLTRVLT